VEESVNNSLNAGFAYYMDEYDKEWLDKNNEEARGEGTSAQGAVSGARSASSQRSAKAKGKEPEVAQLVVMSEDEFELLMAVFEKVTHDKTEYLHHVSGLCPSPRHRINHVIQGLAEGMPFPAFSEYQDTFASPLPPSMFSNFITPAWLPSCSHLLRLARLVYPHWRERRLECEGQRIIPVVNVGRYLLTPTPLLT
jgi:enhancer of polycomb-like protein